MVSREQAIAAVETMARARAAAAFDHRITHAEGRVMAYCDRPSVLILTDDGERVWWRADLTHLTIPDPAPSPREPETEREVGA